MEKISGEIIAAGNLVEREDGKFLMVQEKRPDSYGKWNLPMGQREANEDIIACAKREGKEETDYDLKPVYLIGKYNFSLPSGQTVICYVFKSEIVGGQMTVPEDMLDVKWFSLAEIEELDKKSLWASFVKGIIQDYLAGKRSKI